MDADKFTCAYKESRNGTDGFTRSFVRSFLLSDGVKECADAGCHWLTDIAATELPKALRKTAESLGCLLVTVKNKKAKLILTGSGDVKLWAKDVSYTDMPEGGWMFYVADDGDGTVKMILPTEY